MNALLACERARADAVMAGDLDWLAGLLADDLVYVHAPGQRHDKAQLLAYLRAGPRFLAIDLLNPSVQVMSDCALVVGELEMRLLRNPNEEPVTVRSWVSEVWVRGSRDHTEWKLRLLQSTRRQSPPAA
ncbi:nuclear transport factor 2 family protein [Hydrogenophaga sp.]|uniref:nuclear transport factor 2 family protein n=1 Tax=Hydrogenophaga sp. TaxID=1904254 RepID=UPI002FC883A1